MPYQDNNNNQKTHAFERLNSAAYELAQVSQASLVDDEPRSIHCLRNASEALSQAIELGLKSFLSRTISSRELEYFRSSKSNMPELIKYFIDENGKPGDYYYNTIDDTTEPKVDFLFLKNNKFKLTNQAKHNGPPPDHQIALKYYDQIKNFFQQYLDEHQPIKEPEDYLKVDFGNWDLFYTASDRFAQEERNYILIIGANPTVNGEYFKTLSQCPWDLVIDFDYKSKESGFFFNSYKDDEIAPHQIKASDPIGSSILSKYKQSHYHYYANNFAGSGSVAPKDFKEWNQKAATNTANFISTFARVFPAQKTVVVILFPEFQYVNYLCQVLNQYFGDSASFVIANDTNNKLDAIESYWNATKVNVSIPEIANGIKDFSSNFHFEKTIEDYDLPFLANSNTEDVTGTLSAEEFAKLEEVFEVLHLGLPN